MAMEDDDAYEVLGLSDGPRATDGDIKKAYRKKALALHPDKNRGAGADRAAAAFDRVQKAYELLSDDDARKALDALLRVRERRRARHRAQDEKRRGMVADLEAREEASASASASQPMPTEEDLKAKLKAELERLRELKKKKANANASAAQGEAKKARTHGVPRHVAEEQQRRSLKISWNKCQSRGNGSGIGNGSGDYSVGELRAAFSRFGAVEDIVVRDKGTKAAAIVVMQSAASADAAARSICGNPANPILVVPLAKSIPSPSQSPCDATQTQSKSKNENKSKSENENEVASNAPGGPGGIPLPTSFEKDVLAKLREAAAKQKRKRDEA